MKHIIKKYLNCKVLKKYWEVIYMKLYICKHCGNIISYVKESGVDVMCCGEKMEEIIPSQTDASNEKHIPIVKRHENKIIVEVGEVEHPMTENHFIEWIAIETKSGGQKVKLCYTDKPRAEFLINDNDEIISAYAYCNLHGFWKNID